MANFKYSPIVMIGFNAWVWNPSRKRKPRGNTRKYAIATPKRKSRKPPITAGIATSRSRCNRAGDMNPHV